MKPRKLVLAPKAARPTQKPSTPGLWLDRALCSLLALLSSIGLFYGFRLRDYGLGGLAISGLVAAVCVGLALFDDCAFRRARAVREAIKRGSN
jgi:uncharacterized membrane-anchored protein